MAAAAQQRAAAKQQGSLPSSQYLDAINFLSEATILEACALALSEKDYEEDPADTATATTITTATTSGKSDLKKLLEIEKKCRQFSMIVHKEAIPAPSAMMPPSLPVIPASRVNLAAAKKSVTATMGKTMGNAPKALIGKSTAPTPGVGVIPGIRRGSLTGNRPPNSIPVKRAMTQPLQRSESEESSLGGDRSNKKARLTGGSGGPSSASASSSSDAPPAAALNFLKKLNMEKAAKSTAEVSTSTTSSTSKQAKNKVESKTSNSKDKTSTKDKTPPEDDGVKGEDESNDGLASQREGTRKNPSRGARR